MNFPYMRDMGLCITLLIVLITGFFTMPAQEIPGDAQNSRFEVSNLIIHGKFGVPKKMGQSTGDTGQFFYHNEETDSYYPKYGIMNTLIYLPIIGLETAIHSNFNIPYPGRVFYLNIHNLILSLFCALLFYLTSRLFLQEQLLNSLFTLAVIYTTFCWNHFRAQSFEIHQTLFYAGALYFTLRAFREKGSHKEHRFQLYAALFLSALVLSKSIYVIILPIFSLALLLPKLEGKKWALSETWPTIRSTVLWFLCPLLLTCLLLLLINKIRFGSPWSNGYTQWSREHDLFSGNFFKGLWGFLFNTQFGVFACFPVLLLALFYWNVFYKQFRRESYLIIGASLILLFVNCKFINWTGQMCYGPRYLLPVLPSLALPFLFLLKDMITPPHHLAKYCLTLLVAGVLLSSFYLQTRVNHYGFFTWYLLNDPVFYSPESESYLNANSFGVINADLEEFKNGKKDFPPMEALRKKVDATQYEQVKTKLLYYTKSNYYWFPD